MQRLNLDVYKNSKKAKFGHVNEMNFKVIIEHGNSNGSQNARTVKLTLD